MIKLVTFDLDDTLWPVRPTVIRANNELWEWLLAEVPEWPSHFSPRDLNEGSDLRKDLLKRYPEIRYSMTKTRIRLLEECIESLGYSAEESRSLAKRGFEFFMQFRNQTTPYPQTISMLKALKAQGYLIGALSNGNADVKETELASWFDFQFSADQVGTAKPDPEMFEQALEVARVEPHQAVHIGDHPVNDIQAARELGYWTVWVNPEELSWSVPITAHYQLECLSQIPETVDQLKREQGAG